MLLSRHDCGKCTWRLHFLKSSSFASVSQLAAAVAHAVPAVQKLREAFSHLGNVTRVVVMWDYPSGRNKGYGFVSFATQQVRCLSLAGGLVCGPALFSPCVGATWTAAAGPLGCRLCDAWRPLAAHRWVHIGALCN